MTMRRKPLGKRQSAKQAGITFTEMKPGFTRPGTFEGTSLHFSRAAALRQAKELIASGRAKPGLVIIKERSAFTRGSTWKISTTSPRFVGLSR